MRLISRLASRTSASAWVLPMFPRDRRIVPGLSVRENLMLGLLSAHRGAAREAEAIASVARRFPRLGERLNQEAVTMSGGEQQMLAIARAMLADPKMILLDEPSEGIMPALVDEMAELFLELKRDGGQPASDRAECRTRARNLGSRLCPRPGPARASRRQRRTAGR